MPNPEDPLSSDNTLFFEPETRRLASSADPEDNAKTLHGDAALPNPEKALAHAQEGNRYRTQRVLGAGGMGEVLLCHDTWLGRDVAMKVMQSTADGIEARARFLREARLQGQLEHPAVVPVYDMALAVGGAPSFTMKRIQGQTFREIIEGLASGDPIFIEAFSRRKLLASLLSASQAVAFAHARGIVHRDLKPENIMLGEFGEVYVLDWGIARRDGTQQNDTNPANLTATDGVSETQAGTLVGTPGYMAPEQARGEVSSLSPRCDVYSLGCILFELLALSPYHRERNLASLIAATLTRAPVGPSEMAPNLDIPPELDEIAKRALSLEARERHPSAREFALDIERFLDGQRNAELRQELARDHLDEARIALEAAVLGGEKAEADRARGVRELGRALALDPSNQTAIQMITRVVMSSSDELPPDAELSLQRVEFEDRADMAKQSFHSYLLWIPLVPLAFWMGIRSHVLAVSMIAAVIAVMLYGLWMSTSRNVGPRFMRIAIFLNFMLIGLQSAIAGPLFIVPGAAALTASAFLVSLRANRETAWLITGFAAAATFFPLAAEWLGWVPPSYAFENGAIIVMPRLTLFPETPTLVFLTLIAVVQLAISMAVISRAVRALTIAERKNFAQAYRLGQLLPPGSS